MDDIKNLGDEKYIENLKIVTRDMRRLLLNRFKSLILNVYEIKDPYIIPSLTEIFKLYIFKNINHNIGKGNIHYNMVLKYLSCVTYAKMSIFKQIKGKCTTKSVRLNFSARKLINSVVTGFFKYNGVTTIRPGKEHILILQEDDYLDGVAGMKPL